MRSTFGANRITSGEYEWWGGPTRAMRNEGSTPLVIYCHGAGGTAKSTTSGEETKLLVDLARDHVVISADWAYDSWGSDVATDRVDAAVLYAQNNLGADGPIFMVGVSMGMTTMCNYARRFPTKVAAIAGIVPCVDIADAVVAFGGPGSVPTLDQTYPPQYNDNNPAHSIHSPIHMAEQVLIPPSLPIKIWSLPSDPYTRAVTHQAFVAARPTTEKVDITTPGVYHGAIAVEACRQEVINWFKEVAA